MSSVEIFNTLYMVACMQNIYSFWIIGFLMVFDVFFSALAIRTLSKRYKLIKDFQKAQPVKSRERSSVACYDSCSSLVSYRSRASGASVFTRK